MGVGGWLTPRPGCFTPGKDPVPIVQEGGWAPGPVRTGAKISPPTGFDLRTAVAHTGTLRKPIHNLPFIILHSKHMLILQAGWVAKGSDEESQLACIKATDLPFTTLHLLITFMQRGSNIRNYRTVRVNEHKNVLP
jgi:hypothetical protein